MLFLILAVVLGGCSLTDPSGDPIAGRAMLEGQTDHSDVMVSLRACRVGYSDGVL